MTHLDPHIYSRRARIMATRISAVDKHVHHTHHMLLAAALASLTIVVVAATMMSNLL